MKEKSSNLITVGRVTGVFGIKGWVKVRSYTQPEEHLLSYQPWWLKTPHGVKELALAECQRHKDGWIARFDGIENRTQAESFTRCDVAVEKNMFPQLGAGEFYWHQLIGLKVVSICGDRQFNFGVVSKLLETGANDVMVVEADVDSIDDQERLIPYVPGTYVKNVDLTTGVILVEWDPDF